MLPGAKRHKAWFTPATEAEMGTAHPSVSASASVSTGSHLEVCDVSLTKEVTEENGTTRSFRLRFGRASACAAVSVYMVHTRT